MKKILFLATILAVSDLSAQQILNAAEKEVLCDAINTLNDYYNSLPAGDKSGTKAQKRQKLLKDLALQRRNGMWIMKDQARVKRTPGLRAGGGGKKGKDATTNEEIKVKIGGDDYTMFSPAAGLGKEQTEFDPAVINPVSEWDKIWMVIVAGHEGHRATQNICTWESTAAAEKSGKPLFPNTLPYTAKALQDIKDQNAEQELVWESDISLMDYLDGVLDGKIANAGEPLKSKLKDAKKKLAETRGKWNRTRRGLRSRRAAACASLGK